MTTRIQTMLKRSLLPLLFAAAGTGACQDAPHVAPSGETKAATARLTDLGSAQGVACLSPKAV